MRENDGLMDLPKKAGAIYEQFCTDIRVDKRDTDARVMLPFYFPDSEEPLSLRMAQAGTEIFVTDDGRAYNELCRRLSSKRIAGQMTRYFGRVQLECEPDRQWALTTCMQDVRGFFRYLQTLSLIANADLYPTIDVDYFERYKKYATMGEMPCKGSTPVAFLGELLESITVSHDKEWGVCVHAPFYFNDEACSMGVCFAQVEGGRVFATDQGDFDGGCLYDRMAWLNEDVHAHDGLIRAICARFGGDYRDERIAYTIADEEVSSVPRAYFTFLQLASVLGEVGHFIVL